MSEFRIRLKVFDVTREGVSQLRMTKLNKKYVPITFPIGPFIPVCSRIERLKKFVKAITRPSRSDLAPVRVKDVYRFEEIVQMFERYACIIKLYIWCVLHKIPKHVHAPTGLYH